MEPTQAHAPVPPPPPGPAGPGAGGTPPDGPDGPGGLTRQQQIVLAVLGGLLLLLALVLVLANATKNDDDTVATTDTTPSTTAAPTTAPPETTTTVDLTPVPTTAPPPSTTTTTARPATTTTTAPVLDGRGAVLAAPRTPTNRKLDDGASCERLGSGGSDWEVSCAVFAAKGAQLAWVVERKQEVAAVDPSFRVWLFRKGAGSTWTSQLELPEGAGPFEEVTVRVSDVSGDGAEEATFGFRRPGSAETLEIDVVEGPGRVVVHRTLARGAARVSTGQFDTWSSVDASTAQHDTIRFTGGAWRVVATERVRPEQVPPSQF